MIVSSVNGQGECGVIHLLVVMAVSLAILCEDRTALRSEQRL